MAGMATAYECPILVWMISLNRDYSKEEYDSCHGLVKECVTNVTVPYKPSDPDSFRTLLLAMLPLLMMRHRRIPRSKWRDCVTQNGKHWIEQDDLPPEKFLHSMIGYHLAQDNSLLGMAMTQGPQKKVINIGLGILIHKIPGRATLSSYIESLQHKLTPLELAAITAAPNPDAVLRRLCIILTLKSSYARAIGQNAAFDWARLESDIDKKSATADGHALTGWEFRLYRAKLGVARGVEPKLVEEEYQCCCAFFRGCEDLKFIECPMLVWMVSLNRDYSKEEYDACRSLVKECVMNVDGSATDLKACEPKAQSTAPELPGNYANGPRVEEKNGSGGSRVKEENSQTSSFPPGDIGGTLSPTTITTAIPAGPLGGAASVNGINIAVSQSQSPPRDSPPVVGPAGAGKVPLAFRDSLTAEGQHLRRKCRALIKLKMEKCLAGPVGFCRNAKLDRPIPDNLVTTLAKDEEQQRLSRRKIKKGVDPNQARVIGTSIAATSPVIRVVALRGDATTPHPDEFGMPRSPTPQASSTTAKPPARPDVFKFGSKTKQSFVALDASALYSTNVSGNAKSNPEGASPSTDTPTEDIAVPPDPEQLESVRVKNLFFGVQPFKKSIFTHIQDEFKPPKKSRVTEPNQIAPQWPYHGAATTTPTDPTPLSPMASYRCRSLILRMLRNRGLQARVCSLSGSDAQVIIDYLDIFSRETGIFGSEERRRALSLLCRLANSAKVFPRCYALTGIEHSQEPVAGGGFAEIWKGKRGDEVLCLKVVRAYSKQESNRFLRAQVRELALWAHLSHKNILPFYGVYLVSAASPRICLVSPWMERGNLRDYLNEFPQKPRMHFISDIVDGLLYLHDLQIVHGDLKAQNILVSDDERALITDFGLSLIMTTTTLTSDGGTTRFMAPELLIGDGKIKKWCDIWSFACLCYETLTDKMPFYQYKDRQMFSVMRRKEIPHLPDEEEGRNTWGSGEIDDWIWDLLVRCWSYVPQCRPSCKAIRESLKDIGLQDDRPKTTAEIEAGSSFWQDIREKSGNHVDYARVEDILLSIDSGHALVRNPK